MATKKKEDGPPTLAALYKKHDELRRLVDVVRESVVYNPNPRGRGPKLNEDAAEQARYKRDARGGRGETLREWADQLDEWFPPTRVEQGSTLTDEDQPPPPPVKEARPTSDLEMAEDALAVEPLAKLLRDVADRLDLIHQAGGLENFKKPYLAVLEFLARLDGYAWKREWPNLKLRCDELADLFEDDRIYADWLAQCYRSHVTRMGRKSGS